MILLILIAYFVLLMSVSFMTAGKGNNAAFFRGDRQSPWYMVAFGMIGASISGVSFVSVPGMVMHSGMTYLQTCMGFIVGYIVVAFVLLPVYYNRNLTSIYTLLKDSGEETYKVGASLFVFSKLLGAAAKFFVPCSIISTYMAIPFPLTVVGLFLLIWLYTRRGGIRTLVWTDVLQTLCMLSALVLIFYKVWCLLPQFPQMPALCKVFEFQDWSSPQHFAKCFLSGIFIVIVMTGLDQDMMQKNLTCKTLRDAQKDMCTYGLAFLPVNALFLLLGVLLVGLCNSNGVALPERPDDLVSMFAITGRLGEGVVVLFSLGIVAASFSSADSALTALTTTVCVDLYERADDERLRRRVHLFMMVAFIVATMAFRLFSGSSLIDVIYTMVSYTYGPLLGLFIFARVCRGSRGSMGYRGVVLPVILSPVICYVLSVVMPPWTGYTFGYELLILNGLLTYIGLRICVH